MLKTNMKIMRHMNIWRITRKGMLYQQNLQLEMKRQELDFETERRLRELEVERQELELQNIYHDRNDDEEWFELIGLFLIISLTLRILLAVWVHLDCRKRQTGSGLWIFIILRRRSQLPLHKGSRIGDLKAAASNQVDNLRSPRITEKCLLQETCQFFDRILHSSTCRSWTTSPTLTHHKQCCGLLASFVSSSNLSSLQSTGIHSASRPATCTLFSKVFTIASTTALLAAVLPATAKSSHPHGDPPSQNILNP